MVQQRIDHLAHYPLASEMMKLGGGGGGGVLKPNGIHPNSTLLNLSTLGR